MSSNDTPSLQTSPRFCYRKTTKSNHINGQVHIHKVGILTKINFSESDFLLGTNVGDTVGSSVLGIVDLVNVASGLGLGGGPT